MSSEFEVKFYLRDLRGFRQRLLQMGGQLATDRHLERNWRFDLPGGQLTGEGAVLRVRQDVLASLAFKARTEQPERRQEIEFGVEDSQAARDFLGALGYQQIGYYEKQRETFQLDDSRLMLDQLPFGDFVEIEGPSAAALRHAAARLGLPWELQVRQSYLELFEALRVKLKSPPELASFAAFAGLPSTDLKLIGLQGADDSSAWGR